MCKNKKKKKKKKKKRREGWLTLLIACTDCTSTNARCKFWYRLDLCKRELKK